MYKKECKDSHARVCLSRLTRVLDINMLEDLQQLEHTGNVARNLEIDSNFKPQRSFFSKSSEKINKIMNRKGSHKIFGHSLTEDGVIRISTLINFLKRHVNKEGLFRVSGSKKRQEELKDLIDKEENADFDNGRFSPHDVASVLKIFLGELPEPLLTQAPQNAYLQITEIRNDESSAKLIEAFQLLFLLVPPPNRMLLQQLLELLSLVTKTPHSKMTAHNLAVVFSPNIMDFRKIPKGLIEEIEAAEEVIKKEELPVTRTFCQQMDKTSHKQTVKQTTTDALVQLYNHVIDLPDGPVKQKFLQRFGKVHPGTPPFTPLSKKIIRAEQINASTPLIKSMESPNAFPRTALSPILGRNTAIRSTNAKTPALKKRVAFDVVDSPDFVSLKTPLYRGSPYLSRLGLSTPSGVIHRPLSKHKRTMSVSNPEDFVSPKEHLRYCAGNTPRNKRLPDDTPFTPSGFMRGTVADASCEESDIYSLSEISTPYSASSETKAFRG
ncbi:rho GTPase-activating protein 19-like [Orbicella faveolata]|uniref:rho GTPase-activating protein 19-like n=1 Tax=Orbicella faveolata TaxID=48498 RepID=UPI0009E4C045|nr:rho GTPase-activating protein 19-like [Orbicella faveolata]